MWMDRSRADKVRIWTGDRWDELSDEGETENPPDIVLTPSQMNELVIEWLRGPQGVQGPTGPVGYTQLLA